MSLDVCLTTEAGEELYSANVTHNLNKMAVAAGIYECLWRPDEIGITTAGQIIEPLAAGLTKLVTDKAKYEELNPENGWGSWNCFVPWCASYLQACLDNPDALVRVCR